MSFENNLLKRVNRLIDVVEPRVQQSRPGQLEMEGFVDPALLTEEEVQVLKDFLKGIEPRLRTLGGHLDLSELTNQELDQAGQWAKLGKALRQGDMVGAAACRRWLKTSLEDLVAEFLDLDPDAVPAVSLYRTNRQEYRILAESIQRHIERKGLDGLGSDQVSEMRRWLTYAPAMA